jgi:hypothetical protein
VEFRAESIRHSRDDASIRRRGQVADPALLRWPSLLVASLIGALLFAAVASHDEVSRGSIVTRIESSAYLSALRTAQVGEQRVAAGDLVSEGQLLMRLEDESLERALRLSRQALDDATIAMLRNPRDAESRRRVRDAQFALRRGEAEARALEVRSPVDGRVSSIRVQRGVMVEAGDLLVTVGATEAPLLATAWFPGHQAASIEVGGVLKSHFGEERRPCWFRITEVAREAVSPGAPRRRSDPWSSPGDARASHDSVVVVEARRLGDERHCQELVDGVRGQAETVLRRRTVFEGVLEGLGLRTRD